MSMHKDISGISRSFVCAAKGLRHAYKVDKSFRLELQLGLPIYLLLGWLYSPMAPSELLFFVLSFVLILAVELINTAFEKMLDKVHPEEHELIGKSKDIASAAVLLVFLFAVFVNLVLLYAHFCPNSPYSVAGGFV